MLSMRVRCFSRRNSLRGLRMTHLCCSRFGGNSSDVLHWKGCYWTTSLGRPAAPLVSLRTLCNEVDGANETVLV